jgi:hypothetical protein
MQPAFEARRTVPTITVGSIAAELHAMYPELLPEDHALKLVQAALQNRGYVNTEPQDAVWSSNREQILEVFRVHYES